MEMTDISLLSEAFQQSLDANMQQSITSDLSSQTSVEHLTSAAAYSDDALDDLMNEIGLRCQRDGG